MKSPEKYPLPERIGDPNLLTGRENEFEDFEQWLAGIPKKLSKSRVILGRRKSGKTAFVQRIFNRLWSEQGEIIPLYFTFPEKKIWYPEFAIQYYRTFASQYISFLEKNEEMVRSPMTLDQIEEYGRSNSIDPLVVDIEWLNRNEEKKRYDLMWETAYSAPDRFAAFFDRRILVIIDEFQYIGTCVYRDVTKQNADETLPGSYHDVVESKLAPMLVTGSYVGWMVNLMASYLEAGRLDRYYMAPYLTREEGLFSIYRYAEIYDTPITNETAEQINSLCMSDPFFISCIFRSKYRGKDLTARKGVIETVDYEITGRHSGLSATWKEYIDKTVKRINDANAKNILLHLSKNADREWTPKELKEKLQLDLSKNEIHERLNLMRESDLIEEGGSDSHYKGLKDGTLYLVLRNRFEGEITGYAPDLKNDFNEKLEQLKEERRSLKGKLGNLVGKFAEYQLATEFRVKKRFLLSDFFLNVKDKKRLNIIDVRLREKFQRSDGKEMEVDVVAKSDCGRVVVVEVKKRKKKTGIGDIRDFFEKTEVYAKKYPKKKILPAFLSVGGFTAPARKLCEDRGIGFAENIFA
ncbi:hypothetical protein QUF76_00260 [Desulfobacterales bacterium HSG16]|nr:hypothetical protein [Desulfobacterales bacterium HSG16]